MNKIATYLNEHLAGEVITHDSVLRQAETDGSILARRPDMVVRAADMNDIRKVLRFCSQLAEKGHVLPVFARGSATDATGAAINKGIAIDLKTHMNRVVGSDPKQRLIHVQAGLAVSAANAALTTHKGLGLPNVSYTDEDGTIGGAINTSPAGTMTGAHGFFADTVQQLEVVLSNGDAIQTGRISKRELNKKKGLSTFEGEVYREIDNLIADNAELISQLDPSLPDTAGYSAIAKVKQKDGSFDLTPLFVGSQGSLGIVCEAILRANFVHPEYSVVAAPFKHIADAQEAASLAMKNKATSVELIDGRILRQAYLAGKRLEWAPKECFRGAVVIAIFDEFSDRARVKAAKKMMKKLSVIDAINISLIDMEVQGLASLHSSLALMEAPSEPHMTAPRAFSGIWLADQQIAGFAEDLKALESTYGYALPMFVDFSNNYTALYPKFDSKKVSERQKILQLFAEVAQLVDKHEGSFAAFGGDGRLKSSFMYKHMPSDEKQLYAKVKKIFDPKGIFCPGVKAETPMKDLAAEMNAWCKIRNQA